MSSPCSSVSVSVVVISHNEGAHLRRTVHSLLATLPADGEVIVVDDGSTDGSADEFATGYGGVTVLHPPERLGAARARNAGAGAAQGAVIAFSDAHVTVPLGWWQPLLAVLDRPDVGAVGPIISAMGATDRKAFGFRWRDAALNVEWLGWQSDEPHPVPMLGSGFFAMRREVFDQIGGFDPGLVLWGMEDAELSLRLWTLGYECWLVPAVDVEHLFRPAHPYRLDWETLLTNMLRVAVVHFGPERTRRVVGCLTTNSAFPGAFARLAGSDTWTRRAGVRAARRYDDEWFFRRFGMV